MDLRVTGNIAFTNSVNTSLMRANAGGLDGNNNPNQAGNVTIIVHDPSGNTTPTLTLGNSVDTDGNSIDHLTSIDSAGAVTLQADGDIRDGYDANDNGTFAGAGHIVALAGLSVVSANGAISLTNPANQVPGSFIIGTDGNGDPTKRRRAPSVSAAWAASPSAIRPRLCWAR